MPCEKYNQALIDAAAIGAGLSDELRAHVNVCADCRSTFEHQQSLFSAIDSSLRALANQAIPESLFSNFQGRMTQVSKQHQPSVPAWAISAIAAAFLVAAMIAPSGWQRVHDGSARSRIGTPALTQLMPRQEHPLAESPRIRRLRDGALEWTKASRDAKPVQNPSAHQQNHQPLILVPGGQETILLAYAKHLRTAVTSAPGSVIASDEIEPITVAPIEIAGLEVKPLFDWDSADPADPGGKR